MTATEGVPAPWEIWHARFNFDDRGYKFRPVFVLAYSQDRLLPAMITSTSNKLSFPLDTPLEDWRAAGLTKASLVRVVGRHTVAHEPVRRGKPLKQVDIHLESRLRQNVRRVDASGTGADDGNVERCQASSPFS